MSRRNHQHLSELTAVNVDVLASGIQQCFCEGTGSTSSNSGCRSARGPSRCSTSTVMQRSRYELHTKATGLTGDSGCSSNSHLGRRQHHSLNVALHLQHFLAFDVRHFHCAACFLNDVGTARDTDLTVKNLQVIAQTIGGHLRLQRSIIAVNHPVCRIGSGQCVCLPLMKISSSCDTSNSRCDRCFSGRGVEDFVDQVFTVSTKGSLLI